MPKPGDWLYAPRISKRGGSFVASLRVEVVRIFWQGDLLQALVDVRVSRWKKTGQMSRTLHVEDRQWTLRYWIRRMREAIVLYGESRSHESKITLPYLSAT